MIMSEEFAGSMTLIDAFAESRNIPALRLADKVGIHKVIEVAHRFGVTSDIPRISTCGDWSGGLDAQSRWDRTACFRMTAFASRRIIFGGLCRRTEARCRSGLLRSTR